MMLKEIPIPIKHFCMSKLVLTSQRLFICPNWDSPYLSKPFCDLLCGCDPPFSTGAIQIELAGVVFECNGDSASCLGLSRSTNCNESSVECCAPTVPVIQESCIYAIVLVFFSDLVCTYMYCERLGDEDVCAILTHFH